jgi:hypothetical protein
MTELICPKLNSTHQARKFINSLKCFYEKDSSFKLYRQIHQSLNKTKVKREFTYYFVMKMLKHNRSIREIQLVIDMHKFSLNQASRIDAILYKSIEEIQLHFRKTQVKRTIQKNYKVTRSAKIKISFSNIYGISQYLSMKPIYSCAMY